MPRANVQIILQSTRIYRLTYSDSPVWFLCMFVVLLVLIVHVVVEVSFRLSVLSVPCFLYICQAGIEFMFLKTLAAMYHN